MALARARIDAQAAENAAARQVHDELLSQVAEGRREREAREQTETELRSALAVAHEQLGHARQAQRALARELEAVRSQLTERTAREEELRTALAVTQSELDRSVREEARLRTDLSERISLEHELEVSLVESQHALGALKRSLVGRTRQRRAAAEPSPAQDAAEVRFALDSAPAETDQSDMRLSGWHVPPDQRTLRRLVVRAGKRRFEGAHGLPRPDVEQANPGLAGAGRSGFGVTAQLPPGEHLLLVEAEYDDGTWRSLAAHELRVRPAPLAAAFEVPARPWRVESGPVRFAGWCAHPQQPVTRLTLSVGDHTVECTYGLARPDVGAHVTGGATSGFEATLPLPPGRMRVALHARLESGDEVIHAGEALVVVPAIAARLMRRLGPAVRSAAVWRGMAAHVLRRARDGRPAPPLRALPGRIADLARLHRARARAREQAPAPAMETRRTPDIYASWLRVNAWHDRARASLERRMAAHAALPRVSVVSALDGADLESLLASLQAQVHAGWELCLANANGSVPDDPRVRAVPVGSANEPGIGAQRRRRPCDRRVPGDRPLPRRPGPRRSGGDGPPRGGASRQRHRLQRPRPARRRRGPFRGHGSSPAGRRSCCCPACTWDRPGCCDARCSRRSGGLRETLAGAEDHDLALRAAERARRVGHVPLVLFHDRARAVWTGREARGVGAVGRHGRRT